MMASRVSDVIGYVKKKNVDICRELKTVCYIIQVNTGS